MVAAESGWGCCMHDWQTELNELFARTTGSARVIKSSEAFTSPTPRTVIEGVRLASVDKLGGPEREEINERVASVKAQQQRVIRERKE